jgi:hypothetical protein
MADPTGARMRTMNAFFDSPRFPIKELPDDDDDRRGDEHGLLHGIIDLPGLNAFIGPLPPPQ